MGKFEIELVYSDHTVTVTEVVRVDSTRDSLVLWCDSGVKREPIPMEIKVYEMEKVYQND